MKPSSREVARRVLARVRRGSWATLALAGELGRARLDDADRALATELVYGVLRWQRALDHALASASSHGLKVKDDATLDALRIAAHQLLHLRTPAYAAIDDAVEAVKRLRGPRQAGFVNAVLRRLSTQGAPAAPDLAVATSMPDEIVRRVGHLVGDLHCARRAGESRGKRGDEGLRQALLAFNAPAPTWLRVNRRRTTRLDLVAALHKERPDALLAPSEMAPDALAVRGGGDLFATEAFARGDFTAQDLGAQLAVLLVEPRAGERILDACAGVGGKSTYLAELTDGQVDVDAADLSARKLELLGEHARRLGHARIRPIVADLSDGNAPLAPAYDRVLLDAPCSGLGVLRRHPEAKWRPGLGDVREIAALQRKILDALAPRVRPGGVLVYAVCTFTDEEGPEQVRAFVARHGEFAVEEELRTWPHLHDADAFYAVRLRRRL